MKMKKYILKCLLILPLFSEGFIHIPSAFVTKLSTFKPCLLPHKPYVQAMSMGKILHDENKNKSKVYKMEYSNDENTDWLFEPRYAFGLSEFNMIFIRLYIYLVTILNAMTIIISRLH